MYHALLQSTANCIPKMEIARFGPQIWSKDIDGMWTPNPQQDTLSWWINQFNGPRFGTNTITDVAVQMYRRWM